MICPPDRHRRFGRFRGLVATVVVGLVTTVLLSGATAPLSGGATSLSFASAAEAPWLTALNAARAQANLEPVVDNVDLGIGASRHARYVVATGQLVHAEDPANPNYSQAGDKAGTSGLVRATFDIPTPLEDIDELMRAPFHALAIIDPGLRSVGFGTFTDPQASPWRYASTVALDRAPLRYVAKVRVPTRATMWPGDGSTVSLRTMVMHEEPDPLSACDGYVGAVGLPIVANLGDDLIVTGASVLADGVTVPTCVITGDRYVNPDPVQQENGRAVLRKNAVIMVPRDPLSVGVRYTATIVAGAKTFTTHFKVAGRRPDRIRTHNFTINDQHMILLWEAPDDGGVPITKYVVDVEPGPIHAEFPGSTTGANFEFALPPGPATATIRAVNRLGAGEPLTFGFDVPQAMASTTTTSTEPPSGPDATTTTAAKFSKLAKATARTSAKSAATAVKRKAKL